MIGPRSPTDRNGGASCKEAGGTGSRVASLVQGWEEASLGTKSRPYSAFSPGPTSPIKRSFGPSVDLPNRPLTSRTISEAQSPSSPTDSRGQSPTVPASFFQGQIAKRNVPETGHRRFSPHPRSAVDKENQPSQPPSPASSRLALSPTAGLDSSSASSQRSPHTLSSGTDVSQLTDAFTDLTMATRSSESTHASSLITNSAEEAYVGVASVVTLQRGELSRSRPLRDHSRATPARPTALDAPQIIRTAPTPARPSQPLRDPSNSGLPYLHSPTREQPLRPEGPIPFDRPLLPNRPTSSFIEALPASFGRASPNSADALYNRLPLESQLSTPQMPPSGRARTRPRSSSLGAGLKQSFETRQAETADEKRVRIDREFEDLLVRSACLSTLSQSFD